MITTFNFCLLFHPLERLGGMFGDLVFQFLFIVSRRQKSDGIKIDSQRIPFNFCLLFPEQR